MSESHEFTDVRAHHLVPRLEGRLGNQPTYVQSCACGVTYRNGLMYPPIGAAGKPYDRERAIENALIKAGLDAAERALNERGRSLGECDSKMTTKGSAE